MWTEDERATIREALEFLLQNHETFWSAWAVQKERPSEQRSRIGNALAKLDKPAPQGEALDALARYSHRNGENEEPTEIGYYWIVDGEETWIDFWGNVWGHGYRVHPTARIYGPIPEPAQEEV